MEVTEVEAGLGQEAVEQARLVLHPPEPGLHQRGQLADVLLDQVGQRSLQNRPDALTDGTNGSRLRYVGHPHSHPLRLLEEGEGQQTSRPGRVLMRVYVSKSFKLVALALTLSSGGSTTTTTTRHATAARTTTPPSAAPSARDVLKRRRIARPILGAVAAGTVIATSGLAAAGTAGAATMRSQTAAARALRRQSHALATADEESFTAVWRHAVRSMTSSQVTASSSLAALAAAAEAAARAALHTLNVPGRQRHSERAQKARTKFRHATATKQTVTGKPQVTVFAPGFS